MSQLAGVPAGTGRGAVENGLKLSKLPGEYGAALAPRRFVRPTMPNSDTLQDAALRRSRAESLETFGAQAWPPSAAARSFGSRAFETILAYQPIDLGISDADWSVLFGSGVNVLVVGPDAAIVRLWTALWSTLRKPVCWVEAGRLWFPPQPAGTLVLRNVNELTRKDQERLFYWLQQGGQSTRVLASASRVLFHQVEEGTFLSSLYYRLNTLHLSLNALPQA